MKRLLKHIIAAALTLAVQVGCFAQSSSKMYTRKMRLEDFSARTTKVVISGQSMLDLALSEEVSSRWALSPFEFCSVEQYEALKSDNNYYFLRLVVEDGIDFLSLSKGGKDNEQNNLKKPFEVVRVAIAAEGRPDGREFAFMGAFVDIVQRFVEDAMKTDLVGYSGLKSYNKLNLGGRAIWLDEEKGDALMIMGALDSAVGLVIAPTRISFTSHCYKMLISPDSHELLYYARHRYAGPRDLEFSEKELKLFAKRNGVLAR